MDYNETQIPTPQEQEVALSVFERLAKAVTNAAGVTEQLSSLRHELDQLRRDGEYLRNKNSELDELVASVRRERDEARAREATLEAENNSLRRTVNEDQFGNGKLQADLKQAQEDVSYARLERDDFQKRAEDAEATLKLYRANWQTAKDLFCHGTPETERTPNTDDQWRTR